MNCEITCFERVLNLVKPLPKEKIQECIEIIQEYSFCDFLEFCIENNCFNEKQSDTLYNGIIMWEDLKGNYYEENYEKLLLLYDKVGITNNILKNYIEN